VFCFDGDRAGRQAAWRALENSLPGLTDGRQIRFLFLPEGEDPDSLVRAEGPEKFQARVEEAMPLSDYLLDHLQSQVDMDSLDGRAKLAELARPLLARIPEGIYRDLLVGRLAGLIGMGRDRLNDILAGDRPAERSFRPAARGAPVPASVRSSLVRQAIALLLQHPPSASVATVPDGLGEVELRGIPLLVELLEICRENPNMGTAALIERWRDRPEYPHLLNLAANELLISDDTAGTVLGDTLSQIAHREGPERRTEALLAKARAEGLEPAEKEELRELLSRRADAGKVGTEAG